MVEKELSLTVEESGGSPLQGALVIGAAFGLGSIAPILPHLVATGGAAVIASVALTLAVLFGIGVVKSRWTHRSWWSSGFEILVVGAIAGVAGYFFGRSCRSCSARARLPARTVNPRRSAPDHAVRLVAGQVADVGVASPARRT